MIFSEHIFGLAFLQETVYLSLKNIAILFISGTNNSIVNLNIAAGKVLSEFWRKIDGRYMLCLGGSSEESGQGQAPCWGDDGSSTGLISSLKGVKWSLTRKNVSNDRPLMDQCCPSVHLSFF